MKTNTLIIFALLISLIAGSLQAQDKKENNLINWQGYAQIRGSSDLDSVYNFSVNRLKFWVAGVHDLGNGQFIWHAKVLYSSKEGKNPALLDGYLGYKINNWQVLVGQQIPDFSLQRSQPDYLIAENLRTRTVATLVPGSTSLGRDLGIQVKRSFNNQKGHLSIGIFNGTGANNITLSGNHYLLTSRLVYRVIDNPWYLNLGTSLMQRSFENQTFIPITIDPAEHTGNDSRYGFEVETGNKNWQFQAEYIAVKLTAQNTYGAYVHGQRLLGDKHLIFINVEDYQNDWQNSHTQYYTLGYSYHFAGDIAKITIDNRMVNNITNNKLSNLLIVQFQYMFNKSFKSKYHD